MKKLSLACALLVALTTAAVALGATRADPGVEANSILIGGTAPLSGEASAGAGVARGAEAYFKWVNARGGVNGRKIEYKYLDDGYEPARTVQATRQLVQQDKVFAIFNALGTSNNLAIRSFLNQSKVPQLFSASGATTFGRDYRQYPYTIGYIPSYAAEGKIYGQYILKTRPRAKIAVLYQDDDYGNDLVAGLRKGLGAKAKQIVARAGYDPTATDVSSQVAQLKGSKADTFVIFAFGKFSLQAFFAANKLGWRPKITIVNAVASASGLMAIPPARSTEGAVSIVFTKDPANPAWAKDKGLKLFQTVMKRYYPDGVKSGYAAAGASSAYTMVDVLRKAGKNPTRASVLNAATHLNERGNPFLLPGIVVKTAPNDRFPVAQLKLQRWHNKRWNIFGKMLVAKP
ncbi:MAG: ABC transporter substrate-binding protein [Actinomycetota bacterium]|nr:ABC transporter substrate-binding protein [Actinomycetota bacterium]